MGNDLFMDPHAEQCKNMHAFVVWVKCGGEIQGRSPGKLMRSLGRLKFRTPTIIFCGYRQWHCQFRRPVPSSELANGAATVHLTTSGSVNKASAMLYREEFTTQTLLYRRTTTKCVVHLSALHLGDVNRSLWTTGTDGRVDRKLLFSTIGSVN